MQISAPSCCEGAGDGEPDAAGRAGDKGDFAFEGHGAISEKVRAKHGTAARAPRMGDKPQQRVGNRHDFGYDSAMDTKTPHNHPSGHRYAPVQRPRVAGALRWSCRAAARLGAYQGGVYQALHEAGLEPEWVSGVSIGAHQFRLDCRQCAGPAAGGRVRILGPDHRPHASGPIRPTATSIARRRNTVSALTTALFGQPGLFNPHKINPWFLPPGAKDATSYYDNSALQGDAGGAGGFRAAQ